MPQGPTNYALANVKLKDSAGSECDSDSDSVDMGSSQDYVVFENSTGEKWTQDKEYFFQDGDCTIIAGGIIFKISRPLLRSNSPMFHDALVDGNKTQIKTEESPENVRSLCWVIYTLPNCPSGQTAASLDVAPSRLISALYICHKWQFLRHAEALQTLLFPSPPGDSYTSLKGASHGDLALLLAALGKCKAPVCPICPSKSHHVKSVLDVWLRGLRNGDPSISARRSIEYAESQGLGSFLGLIYYTLLLRVNSRRMRHYITSRQGDSTVEPGRGLAALDLDLTAVQEAAVMSGHWALMRLWDEWRSPPDISDPREDIKASHRDECVPVWQEKWEAVARGRMTSSSQLAESFMWDPMGALRQLGSRPEMPEVPFGQSGRESRLSSRCGCFFRKYARDLEQHLSDSLADYFLGGASCQTSSAKSKKKKKSAPPESPIGHLLAAPTVLWPPLPEGLSRNFSRKKKGGKGSTLTHMVFLPDGDAVCVDEEPSENASVCYYPSFDYYMQKVMGECL